MNHHIFELEPRIMFDAAVAATADAATSDTHDTTDNSLAPTQIRGVEPLANNGKKEVVFVDSSVSDYQSLIDGVGAGIEVELIDGTRDGLAQIAAWAQTHSGYDAIHILSHGSNGAIELGSLTLDNADIASHSAELGTIGQSLTTEGDILLYGCNVADGTAGTEFIGTLAQMSGADIAASTDATGSSDKGGDWTLEAANGSVEADTLNMIGFSQLLGTTTPADQDFDSFTGYPDTPQGSITLDGINYTDTLVEVLAGSDMQGFGWDATLFSNGYIMSNAEGLSSIDRGNLIISSTDLSNDFTLDSFKLGTYSGNGNMAWIVDIIGYQGGVAGVAVASVTGIDLTSGYANLGSLDIPMLFSYDQTTTSYGSANDILSYTRQYVDAQYNGGGLISFTGSNWSNIDTIVIKANSTQADKGVMVGIDSLDFHNTAGPTTTISNIDISADTGTDATDFITKTATQTITGTLSGALGGTDILYGSVDNGSHWTDITAKVSGTTISWDGVTLSGSSNIAFKVTDASLADGAIATQAYDLDTEVPTASVTTATLANTANAVVQSSEIAMAYIVKDTVTVNSLSDITNALDNNFNSVAIIEAGADTDLALTGLVDGTYKVYTVDAAGNLSAASANTVTVDMTAPTVDSIVMDDTALKAGETSGVTITFSEAVTGFSNADLTITNGTLSAVSSADGGVTWTATFTPTADINDPSNIITLANTGVTDVAGNAGVGTTNSANYAIDTELPTVTITMDDTALNIGDTSSLPSPLAKRSPDLRTPI